MLPGCSPSPKKMPPRSAPPSIRRASYQPLSSCVGGFLASSTTPRHGCGPGPSPAGDHYPRSRIAKAGPHGSSPGGRGNKAGTVQRDLLQSRRSGPPLSAFRPSRRQHTKTTPRPFRVALSPQKNWTLGGTDRYLGGSRKGWLLMQSFRFNSFAISSTGLLDDIL